jgi:hypothetical protein
VGGRKNRREGRKNRREGEQEGGSTCRGFKREENCGL